MSAGLVRALLLFSQQAGVSEGALASVLGAHGEALNDPEHRVPSPLYGALLETAAQRSGDPGFAVRLGAASRVAHLGLLGVVLQACRNLGEALGAYARWQRVLGESLQVALRVRGQEACLTLVAHGADAGSPARVASMAAGVHAVCAELVGRPLPWTAVQLPLQEAPAASTLARLMGVPPVPGEPRLCMDAAALAWPIQHGLADPALMAVLQQRLGERERALAAAGTAYRVEAWLRRNLSHCARPQLAAAADALHLSPRAVQHRLQQEGESFRALADRVATEAAVAWLQQGQRAGEVAHALGFSDERAFARALRRWTGRTPAQHRLDPRPAGRSRGAA